MQEWGGAELSGKGWGGGWFKDNRGKLLEIKLMKKSGSNLNFWPML